MLPQGPHPINFEKHSRNSITEIFLLLASINVHCNLKSFLRQGILYPVFYGDMVYNLRKIPGHVHFENSFYKRITLFLRKEYDPVILQRNSRLVVDTSTIDSHAFLFGCAMTNRF